MANSNDTNGTEAKAPSLHNVLHAQWVAAGSKTPSKAEGGKLLKGYLEAHQAKKVAELALEEAQNAETAAVTAIILARGKGRLRIAGEVHIPMSRGGTVYFRREGGGEIGEL